MKRALLALLLVASPAFAQANGWAEMSNGWGEMQTVPGFTTIPLPSGCTTGSVATFLGSPVVPACASDWTYTAGTPEVPESLGPEILTNWDFATGTTGWVMTQGWTWHESVGGESGCVTHESSVGADPLAQGAIPVGEVVSGHTYRISAVVAGTTTGAVRVHVAGDGYGDDTWSPLATESFAWEFAAPAYGGTQVTINVLPDTFFDGSVCSVSIVEVLSPPVPATVSRVELDGAFAADSYSLSALNGAPASATATCSAGEIRWTATHVYLCSATDTWVRAALVTWP